ncbi:MAG TPA: VWA domain-containing protein [Methanothrix sp.]|nr:VWA domain-containing protein [Methanothrix sp.]
MLDENNKKVILRTIVAAVAVFLLVYILIDRPAGPKTLDEIVGEIDVKQPPHGTDTPKLLPPNTTLPDISNYPLKVEKSTSSYIEIFSSPEKAGSGTNGWLTAVARDFNDAAIAIDGKKVSVSLREISSGDGADYIASSKYLPDAYTPSNELWGELIVSRGAKAELVQKRLVGNVAGILLTKSKKDELQAKYGAINTATIISAVANGELTMGYTNPFASSTGLNFLISALSTFDSSNLLSNKAKSEFMSFQTNIPVVAYTTLQLLDFAKSGYLDGFVLEYQTYVNAPDLKSYEFIPFGLRHDNPIYAIGDLSSEKSKILDKFIEFSQQGKYQTLAARYGFNGLNDYKPEIKPVSGGVIVQAQKLWKESGNPICAVFVADVSGSMMGEPLNELKRSLLDGQYYIGSDNMVGLVSYSNDVNIDLPISEFDLTQRSKFRGAVKELRAGGNTATFDAIAVAMKMLVDQKAAGPDANPNLVPVIFVLSDGKSNLGHSLEEINPIVKELGITINTIGYNADIPALEEISRINEGVNINADTKNVTHELANLFNYAM